MKITPAFWTAVRRELMTNEQVREHLGGIPRSTLIYRRQRLAFPAPVLKFGNLELWSRTQVDEWTDSRYRKADTTPP